MTTLWFLLMVICQRERITVTAKWSLLWTKFYKVDFKRERYISLINQNLPDRLRITLNQIFYLSLIINLPTIFFFKFFFPYFQNFDRRFEQKIWTKDLNKIFEHKWTKKFGHSWPGRGCRRYASCGHTGGLSCLVCCKCDVLVPNYIGNKCFVVRGKSVDSFGIVTEKLCEWLFSECLDYLYLCLHCPPN